MSIKVLIKRDSVANFTTAAFIPRGKEIITAYEQDSNDIIFKLGDGKTSWADLPEIKKISDMDSFKVYSGRSQKETIEVILNPFLIQDFLGSAEKEK